MTRDDASAGVSIDAEELAEDIQPAGQEYAGPGGRVGMRCCSWCRVELPEGLRCDAKFCSTRCRQAFHRFGKGRGMQVSSGRAMRFAYADPPYPGLARYYVEGTEVDHAALIRWLSSHDGWALSTSSEALGRVLPLCPAGARVAVWVRGARGRSFRPRNAYEPVIYCGGRIVASGSSTDVLVHGVSARTTDPGYLIGAKPAAFCYWLFSLWGARCRDELVDVFPGSGGVSRAWELSGGVVVPSSWTHETYRAAASGVGVA